jgi:hypothetical protein
VSDTYLRIISTDPRCVPSVLARKQAVAVLRRAHSKVSVIHIGDPLIWLCALRKRRRR